MNWKTTIVLVVLVGAGAGTWLWLDYRKPSEAAASETLTFLKTKMTDDKITRVEVIRRHRPTAPAHRAANIFGLLGVSTGYAPLLASVTPLPREETLVVLEKADNEWALPGNWQTRPQETKQFLSVLTTLHSRFAPIKLAGKADLARYGLAEYPLTIKVTIGKEPHTFLLGEEPASSNRFTRSTFLRLKGKDEVIQLGPGVFAALNRSTDHFRHRRLFPYQSVAKEEGEPERIEQLDAVAVAVETKTEKFSIVKKEKDWILKDSYKKKDKDKGGHWQQICSEDRLDRARRDALLRSFPDLWAERFVENKSLDECGLKEPEFRVTVTKPNGKEIKLRIGKVSETKARFERKQGPPGMPPMAIREEWRYAKLDNNGQLFEIKSDKLSDLAPAIEDLRDPRLARFEVGDVKRLEVQHGGQEIVLVKVKENDEEKAKEVWRFDKQGKQDADVKTVEEFLRKLADLEARGKDVHDDTDVKTVGLDKPRGRIKITLEETDKDDKDKDDKDAKKKKREIVLHLGVKEKQDGKTYVRVDAWPRVNEVGDELWKLASRADLAYRPRELWRIDRDAITRITIQADGAPYHLEPTGKGWKLGEPINAEVSGKEIEALATELAHLQAERFEANQVKDLAKYALDKPAYKITITAKNEKPRTLEIGKGILADGGGRYARLAGGNAVFVVSEKLAEQIRQDPLEMLEKKLWALNPAAIQRIRYQGSSSFALEMRKGLWQVVDSPVAPFPADDQMLKMAVGPLLQLRAQKFAAFGSKIEWAGFGLDKPATTVTITLSASEPDKTTEHIVKLGKDAPGGGAYARIDKQEGVVVLETDTVAALRRTYLDFADRNVLKFDGDTIQTIERKMKDADFEIARREDTFFLLKPGPRDADILTVVDLLRKTAQLQAARIAALTAKDLPPFGLDKPSAIVTFHLEAFDGSTTKHVIKVGGLAGKDADERFAMIDDRPIVVVLSAELSRHLIAPVLYYADRNLASFSNVDRLELTRGERKAVFAKTDTGWKMTQPIEAGADAVVIEDMIQSLRRLRADEIVADKTADLKKYGLDQPFLQWRVKGGDTEHLHLIIGAVENDKPGARRYAKLGNKASVFLLSAKVTAKVQSECASRAVWPPFKSDGVSKLTISNRDKTFVLNRSEKTWKLADDAKAKVNDGDVASALNILESLKVDRWVIDAKADLKKFGLADPAWKIEIELAKEKRVLWLGDYEEKSKHLYATVQGSGAIFVLDEIDSLILARPRSAYVETEKKAEEKKAVPKKHVLLLWHSPDGHPKDTHEYQLGQKILKATLQKHADIEATLICADDPWKEGPDLLAKANGVVLFVSEGAKWLSADEKRLAAFRAGAKRGMGLAVLHWGMGTKDAKNIAAFVELFGGCHGGPDRKYKVVDTEAKIADKSHPILRGLGDFKVRDEFYYTLKFAKAKTPLLNVTIDGEAHPVAWALEREDGGRSFGFSGLHFHENWQTPEYRRLVTQGVMWSLDLPIPKDGIVVK